MCWPLQKVKKDKYRVIKAIAQRNALNIIENSNRIANSECLAGQKMKGGAHDHPMCARPKMKKLIISCCAIVAVLCLTAVCCAENSTFSLPSLNEEGFFSEAFSLEIDPGSAFEWNEIYLMLFGGLPEEVASGFTEEGKAVMNAATAVGDVYEYARLTMYPNGGARIETKLTDSIYQALCTNGLFKAFVPQESVSEYSYFIDAEANRISLVVSLSKGEDSFLMIEPDSRAITRTGIGLNERFSIPSDVRGDAPVTVNDYTLMENIAYGDYPENLLDVYLPKDLDTTHANGVIIEIYGGGWTSGGKEAVVEEAQQYAAAGYIALGISMRNAYMDEEAGMIVTTVFDTLNDLNAGIRKLKELSDENGWNITQCAFRGSSSGGNLALLYAYSRNMDVAWMDTEEIFPVRFVVDVVGPVDMHDSAWYGDEEWPEADRILMTAPGAGPLYAQLLTGAINKGELSEEDIEEAINSMSPVWYVQQGGAVPTLMGYSKRDIIQNPNNGKILKQYLDEAGIRNDLYTFEKSVHTYTADPETAKEFFDKSIEYAQTYFIQ